MYYNYRETKEKLENGKIARYLTLRMSLLIIILAQEFVFPREFVWVAGVCKSSVSILPPLASWNS